MLEVRPLKRRKRRAPSSLIRRAATNHPVFGGAKMLNARRTF
jgi:hypothetical protein